MTAPAARTPKAAEAVRALARRRLFLATLGLAFGFFALSVAVAFLLVPVPVASLTGLIFGALLQVLGCAAGAHGAMGLARAVPLSEPASTARRVLLATVALVLPLALVGSGSWAILAIGASPLLLPALPLYWGPLSAFAAIGLVFSARELASARMAVVGALGAGAVVAMALTASVSALAEPVRSLTSARSVADLLVVGLGFLVLAAAFDRDPWAAKSPRSP